jgi:hypothetical protein
VVDPASDPLKARLHVWHLQNGVYLPVAEVTGEEQYRASMPYPVTVRPADLVRSA